MSTLIFRTTALLVSIVMIVFSLYITLRGHNEPGGGFIGGLIAAASIALFAMAHGVGRVRQLLRVNPIMIAGAGVVIAALSGLVSALTGQSYLTGLWLPGHVFGTPGLFDIGVYLAVLGTIVAVALALEDDGEAH